MRQFISNLEKQNINDLFNQAYTGTVSGITYMIPRFKIRGQALGNQFKFGSINKQINYKQNRDGKATNQVNSQTREKFGTSKKEGYAGNQSFHQRNDGIDLNDHSKARQNSRFSTNTSTGNYSNKTEDIKGGKEPEDQSMDFEGHIRLTANAPINAHHILQIILSDVPVATDAKKKREENKKWGVGR